MSVSESSAAKKRLLKRVKRAVRRVEPTAEVWLYGSRARGEAGAESDWDFLVLLDGPVDRAQKKRIRRALYEIERDVEQVISAIIHSRAEWYGEEANWSPFRRNVHRDAVAL